MELGSRLRELIDQPGLLLLPGAYDAMSARVIEAEGFDAVLAGGNAAIGSMLAAPDMGQSNVRDYADHYARICDAVSIPVYVDGDTGFGGLHNVSNMVRLFESAGVAGIFFSDQVFPNRCGYLPGKEIAATEEMLARIAAALDARRNADLLIVARTDVYAVEGLDAAIDRCQYYLDGGADMAMPQGVDRLEEIERVIAEVPCSYTAILSQAAGAPKVTLDDLDSVGVGVVLFPSVALFAAIAAVRNVLRGIRSTNSLDGAVDQLVPLEDYYDLVGLKAMLAREESYDVMARALLAERAVQGLSAPTA